MTEYDAAAFDAFESAGWQMAAALYNQHWGAHTSRVVDPLLDAAGVQAGLRVLDAGSGPGDAAGRAAERGAEATGVDVAAAMVEIAGRRYPAARFVQASATELPFADESFDAAVGKVDLLATAGFEDVHTETISLDLPLRSADELVAALVEGTVRTAALLRAADDRQSGRVRESLETRIAPWRRGDSFVVPASVKIASGRKPS